MGRGPLRSSIIGHVSLPIARFAVALAGVALAAGVAACGDAPPPSGGPSGEDAPMFARAPYLTRVTEDGARLRWIAPPGARVRVAATAPDGATVRARRGVFSDLAPGTRYRWLATLDGAPAAEGAFTTAPLDLDEPLDLLAFGDGGAGNASSAAVEALLAAEDARLIIGAGDNIHPLAAPGLLDERLFRPLAPVLGRMPLYGTMGDHDLPLPGGRQALAAAFEWPGGGERYALRHGPVQVVALGLEADAGDIPFLRRALARRGPVARFVTVHRPIRPGNPVLPVLARAPVTAVIAGHLHAYERRRIARVPGVPFLTVGTGGAPRSGRPEHTPASDDADVHLQEFGVLRIRLHGDRAHYAFVDTSGAVRDRLEAPLVP